MSMSTSRHLASLAKPKKTSKILPINTPLTLATLQHVSDALAAQPVSTIASQISAHTPAAVLVPLVNINDKPSILFQVRANLRMHGGEVSFPGGKLDEDDLSLEDTVKRETFEEIGLPSSHLRMLGTFGPIEQSLAGSTVYPFVGYLSPHPVSTVLDSPGQANDSSPLPNFDMSKLVLNEAEVAQLFYLSLEELTDTTRLYQHHFRGRPPYWCVNVSDKVPEQYWTTPRILSSETEGAEAIDRGKRLEIWGLTGIYLNRFLMTVGIW